LYDKLWSRYGQVIPGDAAKEIANTMIWGTRDKGRKTLGKKTMEAVELIDIIRSIRDKSNGSGFSEAVSMNGNY